MEDTLLNLEKLKSKSKLSTAEKKLLHEVSTAVAGLGDLFVNYRENGESSFSGNAEMVEFCRSFNEKTTESKSFPDLLQEIEYCPELVDSLPETSFFQLV